MRIPVMIIMLLLSIKGSAQQTATDSAANARLQADSLYKAVLPKPGYGIKYRPLTDTTGDALRAQYGMRIYDPRVRSYLPVDPYQSAVSNPYAYANKQPAAGVKQKPVNKSKGK